MVGLRVPILVALWVGAIGIAVAPHAPPPDLSKTVWRAAVFAGDRQAGDRDGDKADARFNWPVDVVVSADWTVYVADFGNNRIRRIDASGRVSTLAGGAAGFADGVGSLAAFDGPNALILDHNGDLLVADAGNARVRRVTPAGVVTTIAGDGERGVRDGPAHQARFAYPTGLALSPEGTLYVVDRWAHMVRAIGPDGMVRRVAGNGVPGFVDGPGPEARFNNPLKAAWDPHRGLLVTDSGNRALRRVAETGEVITLVGGGPMGGHGPRRPAGLSWNTGLVPDASGGLYMADAGTHDIRHVSASLAIRTVDVVGPGALFGFVTGLAWDPAGNLLVADAGGNRILRLIQGNAGWAGRPVPVLASRGVHQPMSGRSAAHVAWLR